MNALPFSRTIPVRTPQSASRTEVSRPLCHGRAPLTAGRTISRLVAALLLHLQSHAPALDRFGQHTLRLVIEAVVFEAGEREGRKRGEYDEDSWRANVDSRILNRD